MKKVAHVFKSLSAGGIEKWLTDISSANEIDKLFNLNFILQSKDSGFFEQIVKNTTVNIKKIALNEGYFSYIYMLYKDFKINKYDVVHSHVHHFSGIVLLVAYLAGVPIRVAHSHNDKRSQYKNVSFAKKFYFLISKILIIFFSNRKIAVSDNAAKSLFPFSLSRTKILPCGLNLYPEPLNDTVVKQNKKIIGHVGSFTPQKNHKFICKLAADLELLYPGCYEIHLVGQGALFEDIKTQVNSLNLSNNVKFLGLRHDVKELILNDFDVLILPSLHEGLAMVALEAQFYGKPLVVSNTLSKQHTLSNYIQYASIKDTQSFISAIVSVQRPTNIDIEQCRSSLELSPFNVKNNIKALDLIYMNTDF